MVRQTNIEDLSFIENLYFHPRVNPFLLYEMDEQSQFPTIFSTLQKNGQLYIFEKEGEPIGMFKLIRLAHRTSHIAYLGGVAIHPNHAGKGFGEEMMREIIALGQRMGLGRIELSTATINKKAIHLYEKIGFQKEGILRHYTHLKSEGRYLDEVMMSIILS
jgi:putative acetyltransferase